MLKNVDFPQFLTYLAIGANIVVGFVLGGFFYDYGNDGGKVMINFNLLVLCVLFTMYNAMASRVITCKCRSVGGERDRTSEANSLLRSLFQFLKRCQSYDESILIDGTR